MQRTHHLEKTPRLAAGLLAMALFASCGNVEATDAKKRDAAKTEKGESGLADAGAPVRGGRIVYSYEAETTGGWCLPEAQLAISGHMVRLALFDSLAVVNSEGEAVPFLAKSITPNADFTVWTIELRDGITFHDGSPLDATVVKNNIDAYRGAYPTRTPRATVITLKNIDAVAAPDASTVQVMTKSPWVSFARYLAPLGIIGQSQLDDTEHCDDRMVGTGPFKLASWEMDRELVAQRNPDYWLDAPDGEPYPYADTIEFRPITDGAQQVNSLEAGDLDVVLTSSANTIEPLIELRDDGRINMLLSEDHGEVSYIMLNSSRPPFDDPDMRKAMAMGLDREALNELAGGIATIADQPFPKGDPGYVDDPGFPDYDPDAAKKLVDSYVADGGSAAITFTTGPDGASLARAEALQTQLMKIGIEVRVQSVDQATHINTAIGGEFQAMSFRNHPGGEPDEQYVWWYSTDNPTNFGRIKDPVIDEALEAGRAEPDPEKRQEIYARISKSFASEVWNVWMNYTPWAVALADDVHGVTSVVYPDDGGTPSSGIALGHPLMGLWREAG